MAGHGNPSDLIDILVTHKREFPDQFDAYYDDLLAQYKAALPEHQQDEFHRFKALADRKLGKTNPNPQAAETRHHDAQATAPVATTEAPAPAENTTTSTDTDTSPDANTPSAFVPKIDPDTGKTYALDATTGETLHTQDGSPIMFGDDAVIPIREDLTALLERDRVITGFIDLLKADDPFNQGEIRAYQKKIEQMFPGTPEVVEDAFKWLVFERTQEGHLATIHSLEVLKEANQDLTFQSKLRDIEKYQKSLEAGFDGGLEGYAHKRGAVVEEMNELNMELAYKVAELNKLMNRPDHPGKASNVLLIESDINRITGKLQQALDTITPYQDPPHPELGGALHRLFDSAETAKARRNSLIIGGTLLLIGAGGAAVSRKVFMEIAEAIGASAGNVELAGTAGAMTSGAVTTLASMTDAWHSARRDALDKALAGADIDKKDPAQVYAYLAQNPELADQVSKEAMRAASASFLGGRFGALAGKGVKAATGANDWAASIIEEAASSTAERGINTMVSK